jgi:hypothetical protein
MVLGVRLRLALDMPPVCHRQRYRDPQAYCPFSKSSTEELDPPWSSNFWFA